MVLMQLEVLMVTLHKTSYLLVSIQRQCLPACTHPTPTPFLEEYLLWSNYAVIPLMHLFLKFEEAPEFPFEEIKVKMLRFPSPALVPSVQFSRSVMSDSLQPHELQHTRTPCPSPTPKVNSNSCPSSQ